MIEGKTAHQIALCRAIYFGIFLDARREIEAKSDVEHI